MNLFDVVRGNRPKLNKFNLSHEKKLTLNMGQLVPVLCEEILPGDRWRCQTESFLRFLPMLAPIMHRVDVKMEYFFVPNRLLWSEWEDFITGGRLGTSTPVAPYVELNNTIKGDVSIASLADYLGIGFISASATNAVPLNVSALPFRAYQLIYDEYYRDQNLQASLGISKASGAVTDWSVLKVLRNRAWQKDMFTSALPFAQRGDDVTAPITDDPTVPTRAYRAGASGVPFTVTGDITHNNVSNVESNAAGESGTVHLGAEGHEVNINSLRRSVRIQEWLERNARGGSRYIEQILSHFGVKSSDARLQRPEFLGGSVTPVQVSEVLSNAFVQYNDGFEDQQIPQGNMVGHGTSYGKNNGFSRRFEEHGFVMGLMSVMPKTSYFQGLDRKWSRFDKFDYFWPEFAQLGEQEVKMKELYYTGTAGTTPEATFGYQSRYAEYKYIRNMSHADFRSTLIFWGLDRLFNAQPALNSSFVISDPSNRIFAVQDENQRTLIAQVYHRIDALRPIPYFNTPTL